MNPWLQSQWSDVHTRLIAYITDSLSPELPSDLAARAEERIALQEAGDDPVAFRSDVAVVEPWHQGLPPVWTPEGEAVIAAARPLIIDLPATTERWVEIIDTSGRLITVIEVLSPSNKSGPGRHAYLQKMAGCRDARVNLVEIDLIRGGEHSLQVDPLLLPPATGTTHYVCVSRAMLPERREVYPCPLRQRLPAIRIPLRRTDPDIALDLQPLIDRCYELGRYWLTTGSQPPVPPLPEDEASWAAACLAAATAA